MQTIFRVPKGEGPRLLGKRLLANTDYSLVLRMASGFPYTPSGRDIGLSTATPCAGRHYTLDLEPARGSPSAAALACARLSNA
jgi:hypothetical protein